MDQLLVGVCCHQLFEQHSYLWMVLSQVYPVKFVGYESGEFNGLSAVIMDEQYADELLPNVPTLVYSAPLNAVAHRSAVNFSGSELLDQLLHNRTLHDDNAGNLKVLTAVEDEEVLATVQGQPIWTVARQDSVSFKHRVSMSLPDFPPGSILRDHFRESKFIELLPLVHFLARISGPNHWQRSGLKAAFLFDDPNLHAATYGYLDYRHLIEHARQHHYHLALATIPLDCWYANSQVVELFKNAPDCLSLLIHGNNHVHWELGSPLPQSKREALLGQALLRIQSFEQRTGLEVDRVMAAPHGRCTLEMAESMRQLGFNSLCLSRPCPWLDKPSPDKPLAGWNSAEMYADGFSITPRLSFSGNYDDLLFRAWLGQPLVMYGHHNDVAGGLDLFADTANFINNLGDVQWCSLQDIVQSSYLTRLSASQLEVKAYSNKFKIHIPSNVTKLQLECPGMKGEITCQVTFPEYPELVKNLRSEDRALPCFSIDTQGATEMLVALKSGKVLDPSKVIMPSWRIWPLIRRLLTETRDRLLPVKSKIFPSA